MRDDTQKIRFKQNGSNLTLRRHLKKNTESCSWTDLKKKKKKKKNLLLNWRKKEK